jgi:hypothetical protein
VSAEGHERSQCTYCMAVAVVYLSTLGLWPTLNVLRGPIAGRYVCVACGRRTGPFVAYGAHAERALGHGRGGRVAWVLGDAPVMPEVGGGLLLRVQGRRQGVDLAFELGNTAVGFLLAFAGRWGGDAGEVSLRARTEPLPASCLPGPPGFGAPLARHIGALLVAAHLQSSTRVAGAGALEVGCILCRARGRVGAVVVVVVVAVVVLVLLELILVVEALGHMRRRLLQRCVSATAECGWLRQLRAVVLLLLRVLVLVLVLVLVRGGWGQIVRVADLLLWLRCVRLRAVLAVEWREECRVNGGHAGQVGRRHQVPRIGHVGDLGDGVLVGATEPQPQASRMLHASAVQYQTSKEGEVRTQRQQRCASAAPSSALRRIRVDNRQSH